MEGQSEKINMKSDCCVFVQMKGVGSTNVHLFLIKAHHTIIYTYTFIITQCCHSVSTKCRVHNYTSMSLCVAMCTSMKKIIFKCTNSTFSFTYSGTALFKALADHSFGACGTARRDHQNIPIVLHSGEVSVVQFVV